MLSASMSSFSSLTSSSTRQASCHMSKTYRQASTLFLTRRLPEALSTLLPLLSSPSEAEPAPVARASRTTRIKVWSLYLTILNAVVELEPDEAKAAFGNQEWWTICSKVREGQVWEEVVREGYHGVEGGVDSEVVINLATLLLAHARDQNLNQKRLESYLAAVNNSCLDLTDRFPQALPLHTATTSTPISSLSAPNRLVFAKNKRASHHGTGGTDTPRDLNARVKILELYTLHVLLRNNEWDYAREFISMSSVLDDERREAFLLALQSLQEEQAKEERRDKEKRAAKEEEARWEIEETRRLRAENEAKEKEQRQSEDKRAAQRTRLTREFEKGTEVDYGVEKTEFSRSGGGGREHGHTKSHGSISLERTLPGMPKRGGRAKNRAATSAPPAQISSFGARATIVLNSLRVLVERLGASFQANPALLLRMIAFVVGLLLLLGRRGIRERIARVLETGWNKAKATAGMGVRVSYL